MSAFFLRPYKASAETKIRSSRRTRCSARGRFSLPDVAQAGDNGILALAAGAQLRIEVGVQGGVFRRCVINARTECQRIALDRHARFCERYADRRNREPAGN